MNGTPTQKHDTALSEGNFTLEIQVRKHRVASIVFPRKAWKDYEIWEVLFAGIRTRLRVATMPGLYRHAFAVVIALDDGRGN